MDKPKLDNENSEQLSFFDDIYNSSNSNILLPEPKNIILPKDKFTSITGEL